MIHKFFWRRDGASNYAWDLMDSLQHLGHTVVPFSMHHGKNMHSLYEKFFVAPLNLSDPSKLSFSNKVKAVGRLMYSFHARRQLKKLLKKERFDVAHLHNIYHHISPSILSLLKKHGIKIVMTLHDYKLIVPNYTMFHHGKIHEEDCDGWYRTCVAGKCMKNSRLYSRIVQVEMVMHHRIFNLYEKYVDTFISPSQFLISLCVKHGWNKKQFVHIKHPIDTVEYDIAVEDGTYVTYVGRLSEEKGLDTLLTAARLSPNIPFQIIGSGAMQPALAKRIKEEKLKNVELLGFLSGDALKAAMAKARIFVLPSVWYENAPISILEQMASKKVTIASDIGGIPELLPHALLCKPADPFTLAKKIRLWYDAPLEKRTQMGKTLHNKAKKMHNVAHHLKQVEGVYNSST